MANFILDPNMGFPNPTPGVDSGPDYANNLQSSLTTIGAHNHSNGNGVPITAAGININTDFPLNGNNLTLTHAVEFVNLGSTLAGASPFLNTTYVANGNLYFNDAAGNVIKITQSGSVNSTSSGISSGTASAAFSGGVLVVTSNTNLPGNIQAGSILIGNNVVGSNFATVQAPSSLGANYAITLPPTNGTGNTAFLTYDTSNNMGVGVAVTGGITSTNIAASGVATSNIANQAVTQAKLAAKTTGSTVGAGGVAISSSAVNFGYTGTAITDVTGLTITITTTGRPVYLTLSADIGTNSGASVQVSNSVGASTATAAVIFTIGSTIVSSQNMFNNTSGGANSIPASSFNYLDTSVNGTAGTYTYKVQTQTSSNTTANVLFTNCRLLAWEI